MGAWAVDSFGNDDALDWVVELNEADDLSILEETLSLALEMEDYIEVSEASTAVAAAEVVAALLGKPTSDLPDEVVEYLERLKEKPPADLVQLAAETVAKVKTQSELKELWSANDSATAWLKVINDLEARLQ